MIDGQMTLQAQLGSGRCDLTLTIRLYDATRDERVGATRYGFVQHVVELAKLVATKSYARGVFSLHP